MNLFTYVTLGVLAGCVMAGCGTAPQMNYGSVELVSVTGTVKLDGKPLPDAVIKFESPDGQYSVGKTDAGGNYTLHFDSVMKGVTPGEKTVRISTAASLGEGLEEEEAPPGEGGEDSEAAGSSKTERVPEKYNKNSELQATVKPNESQTFDFDLKSQ
jgi:hypothetical protein